jgi:predicted secreted protein
MRLLPLLLLPTLAWAQAEKKDPLDPQMAAVAEVCLQGNSIACMGTADSITPGKEARALWLLTAEFARANPEAYDQVEGFTAEQAVLLGTQLADSLSQLAANDCLGAIEDGAGEAAHKACQPLSDMYALGCFLGVADDCISLAQGSANGTTLPKSLANSLGWTIDACLWGHEAACAGLGAAVQPRPRWSSDRYDVYLLPNRSDVVAEHYEELPGPSEALPFRADVLEALSVGVAGGFAPLMTTWRWMAEGLYADRAAGRTVDREHPLLAWTTERCEAGDGLWCKVAADAGLRDHPGGGTGMAVLPYIEAICTLGASMGVEPPTGSGAQPFAGCHLSEQAGFAGTLVAPLFDDHKSLRLTASETVRVTRPASANPSSGSSSTASSSSSPTSTSSSTTVSRRRSSGVFGLSGFVGVGGIRTWTHKTQASGLNVGIRPSIGPVAFDIEWNWMSDRRWKPANRTWEHQALQFRVHPGIPLASGVRLRLGGGGQFGPFRGADGEGPDLVGGTNQVLELNVRPFGDANVWIAARLEQQQWFGDLRGQPIDHVSVGSLLFGGGL